MRSRRIFTWRSRPGIASKSKLSIARLWRRVAKIMVRLVCARTTTRTTMQLSSLVRTGTTSKWFATNPRPNPSIASPAEIVLMLAPPTPNAVRDRALAVAARAAILVEGWSDQSALQTLAMRRGHDLDSERIVVVPTGGVTNIGHFAIALGPQGIGLRLAGLYDAPEKRQLSSVLRRAGIAA